MDDFVLHTKEIGSLPLTAQNWTSSVFPGCEVDLTIVLRALKLSMLRCPRPDCGAPAEAIPKSSDFQTWLVMT